MANERFTPENIYQTPVIQLFVGPQKTVISAHLGALEKCDFFRRALKGDRFKEAIDLEFHLPDDDPRIMSFVVDWMYSGRLPSNFEAECKKVTTINDWPKPLLQKAIEDVIDAYILTDKLCLEQMGNDIVTVVHKHITRLPLNWTTVERLKAANLSKCPLEDLLIRAIACKVTICARGPKQLQRSRLSQSFIEGLKCNAAACVELVSLMAEGGVEDSTQMNSACKWHTHQNERCPPVAPLEDHNGPWATPADRDAW